MNEFCPRCGAQWTGSQTCQSIFDEFLMLEFTDPDYGEVHFLTVACYMTQHGKYSDEAQAWITEQLRAYLEQGVSVDQIRRRNRDLVSGGSRTWKILRPDDAPPADRMQWAMTIMDVADQMQDAASYRRLINQWAKETLRQLLSERSANNT